ncbi:MAG: tRNA pseudouridine(13) synthase TruD [Nanoarchaeota archaeon]|nr:tRNA pseudouridine(13) synthase TruD [Nanoarchaeota archaeon]
MYRNLEFDFKTVGITGKLFPYSTKGFIKDSSEDFIVKEIPFDVKRDENGRNTFFTLVKNNWTTMQAINKIARLCHVSWKRFSFAGTKDKNAVTKQLVCVKGVSVETLKALKIKDIEIEDVFKSNEVLNLGSLEGNEFTIRVNDYACKNINEVLNEFKDFIKQGLPNYFAEQRFGIQRPNNHLIGKMILREEYEKALKELLAESYPLEGEDSRKARDYLKHNWGSWKEAFNNFPKYLNVERIIINHLINHPNDYVNALRKLPKNISKIFVYAYQSYIFNISLSEMIRKKLLSDFELELPGYDSKLDKLGGAVVEEILEKEKVKLSDFRVSSYPEISCRGTKRKTIIYPKDFRVNTVKPKNYSVSFTLPKGSYATIVMRELTE